MGAWIVSLLVGCMGGVTLCFAGLSNGRVVVFRLSVAAVTTAAAAAGSKHASGSKKCPLTGYFLRSGAAVSLQLSLLSGRVVSVGGGPVRLVSLPRLPSSGHGRSGAPNSRRSRGDRTRQYTCFSPERHRQELALRHEISCVVCCCTSPTIIHVSAAGLCIPSCCFCPFP